MFIKGKFVAQVEIDISADENMPGLLTIDEIKENMNNFAGALKNLIEDEVDENTHVTVTQLYADVWKTEDECIDRQPTIDPRACGHMESG